MYMYLLLVFITLIAAITDLRKGMIFNWLTYPGLIISIVMHSFVNGMPGFLFSILGALIGFTVPYIFFRIDAMGGGDVKLFAVIGALVGPSQVLEIELLSFVIMFFYGIILVTKKGGLRQILRNSITIIANIFLPSKYKRTIESTSLTTLRLGASIFIGSLFCIAYHVWMEGTVS